VKVLAAKLLKAGFITKGDILRLRVHEATIERHKQAAIHIDRAVRRLLEIDSGLVAEMTRWSNEHDIDIPGGVLMIWSALDRVSLVHEWTKWCSAALETVNNKQKEEL
jgi:hypothetical protein